MNKFFIFYIISILVSCNKTETDDKQPITLALSQSNKQLVVANNAFAFEFFSKIAETEVANNYMVSPLSLSLAMGMAYNGSAGATATAFKNVMHHNELSNDEINEFYRRLIPYLASNTNGSVMEIANSIWIEKTFLVKQNFITSNQNTFQATVQNLDFSKQQSVHTINNWVAQKTHNKILEIIDFITPQEKLFLINALYFNAKWKHEFNPQNTSNLDFYKTANEMVSVPFMKQTVNVKYLQNALFSSVILPYKNDKFSMVIFLPNDNYNTNQIVAELNNTNWNQWQNDYQTQKVEVSLPKFKFSYENFLNNKLIDMGLGIAFTDAADFSNISNIPLSISRVLQKTYIDVNEEGTEAAAVTIIGFETTSLPEIRLFNANKPFLYMIIENTSGAICFMGKTGLPVYN